MVLIAIPFSIYPPASGAQIRIHSFIELIRKNNITFHIVLINMGKESTERMEEEYGKENISVLDWQWPRFYLKKIKIKSRLEKLNIFRRHLLNTSINELCDPQTLNSWHNIIKEFKPEVILIEYTYIAWLLKGVDNKIRKIIDTIDVFTDRNWKMEKQGLNHRWYSFSRKSEKKGLNSADIIIAIQSNEATFFKNELKITSEVREIGHIIDPVSLPKPKNAKKIGYFASQSANNIEGLKWFLENVWTIAFKEDKTLELIVGGSICKVFSRTIEGVHYIGYVDNIKDFYQNCSFIINPVFAGTGLKIKTIEALAHGRALIATPIAAEGLDFFLHNGMFICKTADEFIQQIKYLTEDIQNCIGNSEKALMIARFYYEKNVSAMLKILE